MKVSFKSLVFITISAVYFLILVGGIVRSVGAGMGCPDWPKCYGEIIPPTSSEDLPDNYEQQFVEARIKKNQRLSVVLYHLGFRELATKVKNDPSIASFEDFDPVKAWVEYINRLIGVLIGFLIILVAYFSIRHWRKDKLISILGVACFILVLFQGWIGSLVVSTNLLSGFISFHMALALLLVAFLILIHDRLDDKTNKDLVEILHKHRFRIIAVFILFIVQIWLGIQVREEVDLGLQSGLSKSEIVNDFTSIFFSHRTFSLLFLVFFGMLLNKSEKKMGLRIHVLSLFFILLFSEIMLGAILYYVHIPAIIQPLHLLLGSLLFGLFFKMNLLAFNPKLYV